MTYRLGSIARAWLLACVAAAMLGACEERGVQPPAPAASRAPTATPTTPAAKDSTLTVLAAASLADAFREIGAAFESANPGRRVAFGFAGSNQLRTQLEHGAPGDIFASADRKQMDAAVASRVVDAATVRVLVRNRLAIVVPKQNAAKVRGLADLKRPGLKIVVADKGVPVGNYTRLMLDKAAADKDFGPAFVAAFDANTVSREENVAAVVAKVALNEADAGFAYASDAAGANAGKLSVFAVPDAFDQRAEYVIAVTAHAADPAAAGKFLDHLRTPGASAILEKRGFMLPEPGTP